VGRAGRGGTLSGAESYLMKFVLPLAWTLTRGAAGEAAGLARSLARPRSLARSLAIRRLPRARARVLQLPLQPHSNMASSLCACPAVFFKIFFFFFLCSELLQRPFPALAKCLKPISPQLVVDSFLCPRLDIPHTPGHTDTSPRQHGPRHEAPSGPAPLPPFL
jgi:hypothetical protein